jgi:hypothetical protein
MGLVRKHLIPGAAGTFAFLAADAFNLGALGGDEAALPFLNLVQQQSPGDVAIESLLARFLAFHLQPRRAMNQHDARGRLVDVLAAVAAGAHEAFLDVRFAHAQFGHAPRELCFFFQTDRECAHDLGIKNEKGRIPKKNLKREKAPPGASVAFHRLPQASETRRKV